MTPIEIRDALKLLKGRVGEEYGSDFYVYGVTQSGDPVVCPSLGMAHEVAAR